MSNKSWLAVLSHYTLQELGEAAYRYVEDGEHPRQFIGILCDIEGLNVTPDGADQIELIDNDQVNAWLPVAPPDGGDPVGPNTPLVRHSRNYLFPGQFDIAEFYTEPESDSDEEDDVERHASRRRAFPRSHNGWQRRILSNDLRQGPAYISRYAGQDVPMVALPPGIPPPRCEVSVHDAIEEGADDNGGGDGGDRDNGGNGGNA
ncbi:hypothetical protein B9Z19DRAFT_1118093 [Tuber borchii]|uniref:Uncharacterized protein n=1 Tax=Tuber borchii TaxID=42251 RepID=A0A2T7A931_TUBBO|nr:hypothetical protein B9Z19DRAFT_1118093 [Tuber borchii]